MTDIIQEKKLLFFNYIRIKDMTLILFFFITKKILEMNQIKQLIDVEFSKLNKFEQNRLLRRISLARSNYYHFINGDKLGKLGKEKSINVNTFFALCKELGITLSAHKF